MVDFHTHIIPNIDDGSKSVEETFNLLKEAQDEYGYETYYLNISDITEQEYNNIRKLDSFLDENFGGTPMVIIVKNGKIIKNGTWIGEGSKNNFYKFLEKAGYKKEGIMKSSAVKDDKILDEHLYGLVVGKCNIEIIGRCKF